MQPFDLTALRAVHADLCRRWLPARLETVVQTDLWTVHFCLRTLAERGWLTLCWHPQLARLHQGSPPPKQTELFQFGQSLQRLKGLALVAMVHRDPWERVVEWHWAPRPEGEVQWRLILEIMGKYSNVVLADPEGMIVACGHGVSERQSRVRPVQVGIPYDPPPALVATIPVLTESRQSWQERLSLIPGPWGSRLLKTYRGVSRSLIQAWSHTLGIPEDYPITDLSPQDWQRLYHGWQRWLTALEHSVFIPRRTPWGYTLVGTGDPEPLQSLIQDYYEQFRQQQIFASQRQPLLQKVQHLLEKRQQRQQEFERMLQESRQGEQYRRWADLLMANAHQETLGRAEITLPDFASGDPVIIPLQPDKTLIGNAEQYYNHQRKSKRAQAHLRPLLETVQTEISYLSSVEVILQDLHTYRDEDDLETLRELREELASQGYLPPSPSRPAPTPPPFREFHTPSGIPIWVGRSNLHNDRLTFRHAQRQDWWFHAQEIPGSHVLLRLQPGQVPASEDLQIAADLAAYFSRARHSHQVPVVYTRPHHVHKPKGSPPGTVVYTHETVIWAAPTHPRLQPILASEKKSPQGKAGIPIKT